MDCWYGKIVIEHIENLLPPGIGSGDVSGFLPMGDNGIRSVHYPDCQQLIIWLPRPGTEYGNLRLRDRKTGIVTEEWPVSEKLSGSIQVLWDSLPVAPGSYQVEIDWKDGCRHIIYITKYKEGEDVPEKPVVPAEAETQPGPIVYKDGFGNLVGEEDLKLREKAWKDIMGKFSRHIEYHSSGRSGTVLYVEGETRISFYYEFGGGDCVAWIDIPTTDQWEAQTKTPIHRREDIIEFIASRVNREQAPHCRVEISGNSISFLKK